MNRRLLIIPLSLASSLAMAAESQIVTRAHDGANSATIVQQGPDGTDALRVERAPGYLSIERHRGNNHAIIIQDSGRPEQRKRAIGRDTE